MSDTSPQPVSKAGTKPPRRRLGPFGLSTKLLVLTIGFVMLAEVLIYVPSIANFRLTWLKERVAAAQLASLALEAAPDSEVSDELTSELLTNAQVLAVVLRRGDARWLILESDMPPELSRMLDLREDPMRIASVIDAFDTLFAPPGRAIGVVDMARHGAGEYIEVVIDETPLKAAMLRFSVNVLSLSIVISIITAILVYLTLNWVFVRPMRRLTQSMLRFSEQPEDASRVIAPSGRGDEIGAAEGELAAMQHQLHGQLQQKQHLAALGLAVSKINHDLRNMLGHAQLLSDRLGTVKDPAAEGLAPKLIASLDRAIELCTNTLKYGKAQEAPPNRRRVALAPLVREVAETFDLGQSNAIRFSNDVPDGLVVDADPDQLFRVLMNLVRNAVQAIESAAAETSEPGQVRVAARREGSVVTIEVSDNGPGVPETVREHLFEAFRSTARPGGAGLGLAIAAELTRAHGGRIRLADRAIGATFELAIPDRVASLDTRRAARARG